jgi:hypothetical protein
MKMEDVKPAIKEQRAGVEVEKDEREEVGEGQEGGRRMWMKKVAMASKAEADRERRGHCEAVTQVSRVCHLV